MNFQQNNAGLDSLIQRYQSFKAENPEGKFSAFHMPIEQFQKAPDLTKAALGDRALDTVSGVLAGEGESGAVALFTGNGPSSPERASFIVDMLSNFDTFYSWMKAYLDIRQNGFTVTYRPTPGPDGEPTNEGDFLAIGPGFQSLAESPYAVASTADEALAALLTKFANAHLLTDEMGDEERQLIFDTEWTYVRDGDAMVITGRWVKPGTRLAVKTHRTVPLDTAEGSQEMINVKREIVADLYVNRERAGGVSE